MLPITTSNPFKWRHYPGDIIMWCVRWYLRYPISFTHMAEMAVERGLVRMRKSRIPAILSMHKATAFRVLL